LATIKKQHKKELEKKLGGMESRLREQDGEIEVLKEMVKGSKM
jgi:hypothetical protein